MQLSRVEAGADSLVVDSFRDAEAVVLELLVQVVGLLQVDGPELFFEEQRCLWSVFSPKQVIKNNLGETGFLSNWI